MEDNLFLLLRLGLGTELPSEDALNKLSSLSGREWCKLRDLSERQGVAAIVVDGLNILFEKCGHREFGSDMSPKEWQLFLLEWMGNMLMLELSNRQQEDVMEDIAKEWKNSGCKVMVMKGQAHGRFYPHPYHRAVGDIDVYLFGDFAKGNEVAKEIGADVDESWYKHAVISYKGETIENHQYFVTTRTGKGSKWLEKDLEDELKREKPFAMLSPSTVMPTVQWTAMFMTYHSCSHFLSEGLHLKQLLDWAMLLCKHQEDIEWYRFYDFCEKNHLGRFADASTAIAKGYLGVKVDERKIRAESPYVKRVLESLFYDDDFVFGSGKGDWYNRFHLIKNLWTYRWKYREIYQMSPLLKLWNYATGFIFKTE